MAIKKATKFLVICIMAFGFAFSAQAAAFPERTINMIIPFAPGGSSDVQGRLMEKYWNKHAPVKWNFIYKPGAGGMLGFTDIAKARPDGYTVGNINIPHMVIQARSGNANFKVEDFNLICLVVHDPGVIVVRKDSKYQTLDDLVKAARAEPNKLKAGLSGPLSANHLLHIDLATNHNLPITPIFYPGGAGVVSSLLGGETDCAMTNVSEQFSRMPDEARILAVASTERSALLPDVPTMKELGYDVTSGETRRGYAAPMGMAPERIKWLRDMFDKVGSDPEYKKEMLELFFPEKYLNAVESHKVITEQKEYIDTVYHLMETKK